MAWTLGLAPETLWWIIYMADFTMESTRAHQHLHLFERLQSAMDYYIALVSSTMGTTATLRLKDKLPTLAINIRLLILLKSGLMAYYERDGSYYKKMGSHSSQALQMPTWPTRSLLVTGCDYAYVTEC